MEKPGEISSSSLKHKRKATLKKNNYYNFFKKSNPKQISYAFLKNVFYALKHFLLYGPT